MDAIISALQLEREQSKRLIKRYQLELKKLPKGSFFLRRLKRYHYGYLTYNEGSKIKQKYLGRLNDEEISHYKSIMVKKKKLKELILKSKKQLQFLERAVKYAKYA